MQLIDGVARFTNKMVAPRNRPAVMAYLLATRGGDVPCATGPVPELGMLGFHAGEDAVYLASTADVTDLAPPVVFERLALGGPYAGQRVPLASWHAPGEQARLAERTRALLSALDPLVELDASQVALTTRVVVARAVKHDDGLPVRKFLLDVGVRTSGAVPAHTQVVAYGRPRVELAAAWQVPRRPFAVIHLRCGGGPAPGAAAQHVLALAPRRMSARITVPMAAVSLASLECDAVDDAVAERPRGDRVPPIGRPGVAKVA